MLTGLEGPSAPTPSDSKARIAACQSPLSGPPRRGITRTTLRPAGFQTRLNQGTASASGRASTRSSAAMPHANQGVSGRPTVRVAFKREPDLHESVHALTVPDGANRWLVSTARPRQQTGRCDRGTERFTRVGRTRPRRPEAIRDRRTHLLAGQQSRPGRVRAVGSFVR